MIRRLCACALGLVVAAGLLVSPWSAPPAQAETAAVLTFQQVASTVSTPCGPYTFTATLPVLQGSTRHNRAAVSAWADFVRKGVARFADDAWTCQNLLPSITIQATSEGSIYQGRYLSVVAQWRADVTGRLKTLTLDLKTGKQVPISRFASNKGKLLTWAECSAFVDIADYLYDSFCPHGEYRRALAGWRVSDAGIDLYGAGDDGYYFSPRIAWSGIVAPRDLKARKHVTRNVPTHPNCGSTERSVVTVRGNLVVVAKPRSKHFPAHTAYGVRSAGMAEADVWRVPVMEPSYGPSEESGGLVDFASSSSTTALQYWYNTICGE